MTKSEELAALVERATLGPWEGDNSTISWWIDAPKDKSRCWISGHLGAHTWHEPEARMAALVDRDFIVWCRNNADTIIEALKRMETRDDN